MINRRVMSCILLFVAECHQNSYGEIAEITD